ncbi:MAG: RNA 2',3'-cyclic phosphodiesterase [Planctomycetes bacterium]|nr:RNA 2',3'-cyclic phosphodiesterase [Planctomycetota bacterium]
MRTFMAVRIVATPALEIVLSQLSRLRPSLKVVAADELHVTLPFLGETRADQVPELAAALQAVAAAEHVQSLKIHGLGAFPSISRPNVVWAGFENPVPLVRWSDRLWERCEALGFAREARPFHPHITLARVKSVPPASLIGEIQQKSATDLGDTTIDALVLFRSDPGPAGPCYTSIASARLPP